MQYNPKVLVYTFQYPDKKGIPVYIFSWSEIMGQNLCSDTLLNQSKYVNEWSNGVFHLLVKIRISLILATKFSSYCFKAPNKCRVPGHLYVLH